MDSRSSKIIKEILKIFTYPADVKLREVGCSGYTSKHSLPWLNVLPVFVQTMQSLDIDSARVEHWPRKSKASSSNPSRCDAFLEMVFCFCDKWRPRRDCVLLLCGIKVPRQTFKSATELRSRGQYSLSMGKMSQVFVITSRLIPTRHEGYPLAHSAEHWLRNPKDPSWNHSSVIIFHSCICIYDNAIMEQPSHLQDNISGLYGYQILH